MIEAQHLTKRYGKTVAVDEVSFVVQPGRVTGFLGPNGAGKSTTMRMILGLDTPSSGSVLVNGKPYRELNDPLRSVGALLDAKAIVGGRSAANHLTWLADSNGIDRRRVERGARHRRARRRGGQAGRDLLARHESAARASPRPCSATPTR